MAEFKEFQSEYLYTSILKQRVEQAYREDFPLGVIQAEVKDIVYLDDAAEIVADHKIDGKSIVYSLDGSFFNAFRRNSGISVILHVGKNDLPGATIADRINNVGLDLLRKLQEITRPVGVVGAYFCMKDFERQGLNKLLRLIDNPEYLDSLCWRFAASFADSIDKYSSTAVELDGFYLFRFDTDSNSKLL